MKVLLISANKVCAPFPVYPIGLDYLAGALKPEHAVKVLDLIDKDAHSAIPLEVKEFQPDCVGLSIRNIDNSEATDSKSYIEEYKEIVRIIRDATHAPLVLGGAGFSLFPESLFRELGADFGIAGEGERLNLLLDALEKGSDPEKVPGLICRKEGFIRPGPWEGDIKRELPENTASSEFYTRNSGMLNLQTKRGCPFNCIYCTYPVIEGTAIRRADPALSAKTAIRLKEKGAKYIYIADSVFNSDHEHCLRIAEEFEKAGLDIPWGGFFSPLSGQEGLYQKLKQCGLTHCEFGTESLSERMLMTYRKPFDVNDVMSAHESAIKAGLHVCHYFLLGGPGESIDSIKETLENAEKLVSAVFFFFCGIRIYPGTELYNMALTEGRISPDDDLLKPVFYESDGISTKEIEEMIIDKAAGRRNWVIGSGGSEMNRIMARLYSRGRVGPLWEKLI
jgi:radical SAM superfamily enzyme YgiQ (UPF0313 family)